MKYLADLCEEAGLSSSDRDEVIRQASHPSTEGFDRHLQWLKDSELRYSFVVDTIALAKAEGAFTEAEKEITHQIANRLGITNKQYEKLHESMKQTEQSRNKK